jgi:hypothetical protein
MGHDRSGPEDIDDHDYSIRKKIRIGGRWHKLNIDVHRKKLSYPSFHCKLLKKIYKKVAFCF